MPNRIPRAGALLMGIAASLAVLLALLGLVERLSGPDIPFRLRHLQVIPRDGVSSEALLPLREGDRLIGLGGEEFGRDLPAMGKLARAARGGEVELELQRGGAIRVERVSYPGPNRSRRLSLILRSLAALLVFATGIQVARKRWDPLSRVFLVLTLLIGSAFAIDPRFGPGLLPALLEALADLTGLFLPPVMLHFLILFPERRPRPAWIKLLLYLPSAAIGLFVIAGIARDLPMGPDGGAGLALQLAATLNLALFLLLSLGLIVLKSVRRKYRRERYRLRRVLLGAALSLIPLAIFQLMHQLLPARHFNLSGWTPLFLTFLPLSFAYGILGPNLNALNRRIREFGRGLLLASLISAVFLAMRYLLSLVWGRSGHFADDLGPELLALGVALSALPFLRGRGAAKQEDRPFRDSAHWLAPPRFFTSREELRRSLLPRLGWDSGASRVLWLRQAEGSRWILEEGWRREGGPARSLPIQAAGAVYDLPEGLNRALLDERRLLAVEQWDPYWAESLMGSQALEYCKSLDWSLLTVAGGEDSSPAMIVMGPKVDGSLYATELLEDLRNLLSPLQLHLRNISLLSRVAHEKQLLTELELARNIQIRLMPRAMPELEGLEFAARMIPSSEVGGDYFDFLRLPDGQIGLALGDATGHGIPAALLISSVALAFHSEAAGGKSPDQVLSGMNGSLCSLLDDSSDRGTLAGFVYARFDAKSSTLHYCNGGMPSPWLFRREGPVERLSRGGTLLGAQSNARYRLGTLKLRPGDLLFLRSDGVEDQENEAEELFGEERLRLWVESNRSLKLEEMAEHLLATLQDFSRAGANDDISFIFMRIRD